MKIELLTSNGIKQCFSNMVLMGSKISSVEIESYIKNNCNNIYEIVEYLNSMEEYLSTNNWQVVNNTLAKGVDAFGNIDYITIQIKNKGLKDVIREYFKNMLEDDFNIESAKDNLIQVVEEIANEF